MTMPPSLPLPPQESDFPQPGVPDPSAQPVASPMPPPWSDPASLYGGQIPVGAPQSNSGLAIASLVLGLAGLVLSWFTFGIPSLLALIFGIVGIRQTTHRQRAGRGLAVTGTVLGAIMLLLGAWVSTAVIYGIGSAVDEVAKSLPTPVVGTRNEPLPSLQAQTTAPPAPSFTPGPADFRLTLKTLKKACFGSAGCNVTYRIQPTYIGTETLEPGTEYEVTYEVRGGQDGAQTNTFTLQDGNASVDSEEFLSTTSSGTKLTAKVTDVAAT
jgi:hypothetical protein